MLVLGRNLNEPVVIDGKIFVKVVRGKQGGFKIAIDAPRDVSIVRGELFPGKDRKTPCSEKYTFLNKGFLVCDVVQKNQKMR